MKTEIIVIGAGVCGLTAACLLKRAGFRVEIVEARNRVGGRILTLQNPLKGDPVELGAELVHGLPEETRRWLDPEKDLEAREGDFLIFEGGQLTQSPAYFEQISGVMERLSQITQHDLSFQDWLEQQTDYSAQLKDWVTGYIQGYHGADASDISGAALREIERESQEVDAVEGAQFFRGGQSRLLDRLIRELNQPILLNHVVKKVSWSQQGAEVSFTDSSIQPIQAKKILVTVPIGVLQAPSQSPGAIDFEPPLPSEFASALSFFKMGTALKMNFVFKSSPWSRDSKNSHFAMILDTTPGAYFRVWWRRGKNQIVGWQGGPSTLLTLTQSEVQKNALEQLARIFKTSEKELERELQGSYVFNWSDDPFSRGVYPYIRVGGLGATQTLARPIGNVLYFAGDATCLGAYLGTINGAMISATNAAQFIVR